MDRDDIARQRSRRPISIDYPDGKTFTFNTKNSGNVTIQLPKGINGPINFLGEGMEAYVLRAKQRDKDVKVKIFKKLPMPLYLNSNFKWHKRCKTEYPVST